MRATEKGVGGGIETEIKKKIGKKIDFTFYFKFSYLVSEPKLSR